MNQDLIESVFTAVFQKGDKSEDSWMSPREQDGTYCRESRTYSEVSTYTVGCLVVRCTIIKWTELCLSSDKEGTRYTFETMCDSELLFKATREGSSTSKEFGPEEMYLGTTDSPAQDWVVQLGEIPQEIFTAIGQCA